MVISLLPDSLTFRQKKFYFCKKISPTPETLFSCQKISPFSTEKLSFSLENLSLARNAILSQG
jgi:hypothetical protein